MRYNIIDATEFRASKRWNAEYFLPVGDNPSISSPYRLCKLRELVSERREFLFPGDYPDWILNFVGLENISQSTRRLVDFSPRTGGEIKSRSKIFRKGDVLYGRLRPSLNKCLNVGDFFSEGICSTEIFVLVPELKVIDPEYLGELLVSGRVRARISALVAGAALPRVQLSDFLDIEVPIPELEIQRELVAQLKGARSEFERHLQKAQLLPRNIAEAFARHVYDGEGFKIRQVQSPQTQYWDNALPS